MGKKSKSQFRDCLQINKKFFIPSLFTLGMGLLFLAHCAVFETRPLQEFSDAAASLKAAKEVQADTLAPAYFRKAEEWFFKAKTAYRYKNFFEAKKYVLKAKLFSEKAEMQALLGGALRSSTEEDPLNEEISPLKKEQETAPPSAPLPKKKE